MNEPIISPWLIYIMDILPSIEFVSLLLSALYLLYLVGRTIYEEKFPSSLKFVPFLVGVAITILIPSKETMYQMLIAYNVTPELLLKSGETAEIVTERALELITDSVTKIVRVIKE